MQQAGEEMVFLAVRQEGLTLQVVDPGTSTLCCNIQQFCQTFKHSTNFLSA